MEIHVLSITLMQMENPKHAKLPITMWGSQSIRKNGTTTLFMAAHLLQGSTSSRFAQTELPCHRSAGVGSPASRYLSPLASPQSEGFIY